MPTWQDLLNWVNNPARTEADLRRACSALGLNDVGTIDELRDRLRTHIAAQPNLAATTTWAPPGWAPPAPPTPTRVRPPTPVPWEILVVGAAIVAVILLALWALGNFVLPTFAQGPRPTPIATALPPAPTATPTKAPIATAVPPTQATPVPTVPTPTSGVSMAPPTGPVTNSPNIKAQAATNGFTAFAVDGQEVGGPAEQWWPLQRADGNFVPNSFKMVGMRQTDRGLPGYEMQVPDKMIMDVWLDNSALTNRKTAVRIYGPAAIRADFRVAEATLYARPMDFVQGLSGKWARLSDSFQCGNFVPVGTIPPVISGSGQDCHNVQ